MRVTWCMCLHALKTLKVLLELQHVQFFFFEASRGLAVHSPCKQHGFCFPSRAQQPCYSFPMHDLGSFQHTEQTFSPAQGRLLSPASLLQNTLLQLHLCTRPTNPSSCKRRPTCNQLLSEFCKDLIGIQQILVDKGVTLSEA